MRLRAISKLGICNACLCHTLYYPGAMPQAGGIGATIHWRHPSTFGRVAGNDRRFIRIA
jgi:hypothetical protein